MQIEKNQYLSTYKRTTSGEYIPALTGLRAVAANLVFWHHHNPTPPGTFTNQLINQAYIGVSFFFVLSGFLIYHRYANDFFEQTNWSWQRYLRGRFDRIFPLYFVILFLTLFQQMAVGRLMSWPLILLNLTLSKGLFANYKFTGIAQSWSLTVEICFYLLAPFLFVALKRWGIFLLSVCSCSVGLLCWLSANYNSKDIFSQLSFIAFYTFFGRGFEFIAGMWLAQQWQHHRLSKLQNATYIGLIISSFCLIWQTIISQFTIDLIHLFWSELVVYNYILPVGISLFFLGLLLDQSIISRCLSLPVMQALGRSSYAFYLIHNGVIAMGLQKMGLTKAWILFPALVLIAHIIDIHFEKLYKRIGSRTCRR